MHTWIVEADPGLRDRISSYRAGFLPEERREIESRLFSGELLGVISTSALEMGIDVGQLDVCLLVGYPGSQIATWQRSGRVGRAREGLVALVAQPDALDQYLVHHPRALFDREFERAVVDPANAEILAGHLPCAAAETPLRSGEPWLAEPAVRDSIRALEDSGELLRSERGSEWFASRRRPHRHINLRAGGETWRIVEDPPDGGRARMIGTVGSVRALSECHEGAIYLHRARQYLVRHLDLGDREARVVAVRVPHYTRALSEKETEILERRRCRPAGSFRLVEGRVRVTTRIQGFERRRIQGQDLLGTEPLDLPPTSFETSSLWLEIPDEIPSMIEEAGRHPMGGLHATEHAALSLFPLFALCDRHDVAGISSVRHPQTGHPAIFFYDAHPGGVGLVSALYDRVEALLGATLELIEGCGCDEGCPGCVHSPKCGSGNRPIDKAAALRALRLLTARDPLEARPAAPLREPELEPTPLPLASAQRPRVVFFDLETQRSAADVGGWGNAHLMRVSLAVVHDEQAGGFETFSEAQHPELLAKLRGADLVVGFNVRRFDYHVLRGYTDDDLDRLPTFDLLDAIHARLGFRVALGHLGPALVAGGPDRAHRGVLPAGRGPAARPLPSRPRQGLHPVPHPEWRARAHPDTFQPERAARGLESHGRTTPRASDSRCSFPPHLKHDSRCEPASASEPAEVGEADRAKASEAVVDLGSARLHTPRSLLNPEIRAYARVQQLEVEQHEHVPHLAGQRGHEAARSGEIRDGHDVLYGGVDLLHARSHDALQVLRALREGLFDRAPIEEQMRPALAGVQQSIGVHGGSCAPRGGPAWRGLPRRRPTRFSGGLLAHRHEDFFD
jgi:DEAD/DEAH box helicase domain-containing protein